MSTTANKQTILEKLGGDEALKQAVKVFYSTLVIDERVSRFFVGHPFAKLEWHQYNFMKIAFTKIPDDLDVPLLILKKHAFLFANGLDETHFDVVAEHFILACQKLGVKQDVIDEAVGVIAPLRAIFEQGAATHKKVKRQKIRTTILVCCVGAVVAAVGFSLDNISSTVASPASGR
jgi:hemoglobin